MKKAFTLSEVLITLVVIGVVAAVTVPIIYNLSNDKQYTVGMQKAKATIGEAYMRASVNGEITKDITSAKDFVDNVLAKRYLKILKSCDNATDCGFSTQVKRPDGKEVDISKDMTESTDAYAVTSLPDFNATSTNKATSSVDNPVTNSNYKIPAYFQTIDGFSVKMFYNPFCAVDGKDKPYTYNPVYEIYSSSYPQLALDVACFYGVYDMNGLNGPNTVGKDIGFVGSFYNGYEAKATATLPYNGNVVQASETPGTSGTDYPKRAVQYCQSLDSDGNWTLPDIDELSLIFLNRYMVTDINDKSLWSRSVLDGSAGDVRHVIFSNGRRSWRGRSNDGGWIICVRNTVLK